MSTYPNLTRKQERFVHEYLKFGNASRAYRMVYDVSPTCKPNTIEKRACELLKNRKVAGRVQSMREKLEKRQLLSLEEHMDELQKLRDEARVGEAYSAAIKAEELRGKLRGFYVEQHEVGRPGDFGNMEHDKLLESVQADLAEFGGALLEHLPATPAAETPKARNRVKGNGTQH